VAERELNEAGKRDLSLEVICAPVTVAAPTREGQVVQALGTISYRCGRYGVSVKEYEHLRDAEHGVRSEPHAEDPHDFWLVFELRGRERRVHVKVA
jgi:hypothetical protein